MVGEDTSIRQRFPAWILPESPGMKPSIAIALALLALAGCGDSDPTGPGAPLVGAYDRIGRPGEIIVITEHEFTLYEDVGPCWLRSPWSIAVRRGNEYTIEKPGDAERLVMEVRNDTLYIISPDIIQEYERIDFDPASLNVCREGPGGYPTCDMISWIPFPGGDDGTLSPTDPLLPGEPYHYDQYRIVPSAPARVRVTVSSTRFDPFVRLLTSDGDLIAENTDIAPGQTDARVEADLEAGCHIIVVSSLDPTDNGAYHVEVEAL